MIRSTAPRHALWPDYRTLWRWHFYAGLLCLPFVTWLAVTGSIYLFKPQVEAWLERPYDQLVLTAMPQAPSQRAKAALAAVPGSTLRAFELPTSPMAATRVIVSRGAQQFRVYVRPDDLKVLKVLDEDRRFMRTIFRLHGELLMGDRGSYVVELAASWAIVMLVTGLCLWWPRGASGLGGVLWPRFGGGSRQVWRDLHAVAGVWISLFAIILLLTGLPWAKNWGGYLKEVRRLAGADAVQDWTNGRASELAERRAADAASRAALDPDHAEHMNGMTDHAAMGHVAGPAGPPSPLDPLDRLSPAVAVLALPPPVLISPPTRAGGPWTAKSDTANRPQRVNLTLDPETGRILSRADFAQRHWIDRVVGTGVAVHEGQLFGWLNQLLGLLTAAGLVLLTVSGAVMWWKRRPAGVLGAPPVTGDRKLGWGLVIVLGLLAVYLPMLGASLIVVAAVERLVLRRVRPVAAWLGLNSPA